MPKENNKGNGAAQSGKANVTETRRKAAIANIKNSPKKLNAEEQLAKLKAEGKKVFKEKEIKSKAVAEPGFERSNFKAGLAFVEECKKLGCQVKMCVSGRTDITHEPGLSYNGKSICFITARAGCRFGQLGIKGNNRRIHNDAEQKELLDAIKAEIERIKKLPKKVVKEKKVAPIKATKSFIDFVTSMEARIANLSKGHNAIKLPAGLTITDPKLAKWAKEQGYEINTEEAIVIVHK